MLCFLNSTASAYYVARQSLEDQVRQSDLVALGVATGHDHEGVTTVKITTVLKGHSEETIHLVYRTGIAELDPICCEAGKTYFLLLRRISGSLYETVNGPYGAVDVGTSEPPAIPPTDPFAWPGKP